MENTNDLNGETKKSSSQVELRPGEIERVGGPIELKVARSWTQNYRRSNKDQTVSHLFGKEVFEKLLKQKGCVGIRIYYGNSDSNGSAKKELILVGVDRHGNNQLPKDKKALPVKSLQVESAELGNDDDNNLYDQSWPCPGLRGCPNNSI